MPISTLRRRPRWVITGTLVVALVALAAGTALGVIGGDDAAYKAGTEIKIRSEFGAAPMKEAGSSRELMQRNAFFMSRRTAGTEPLDAGQAGAERAQAAWAAKSVGRGFAPSGPTTFNAPWAGIGPNPIIQGLRSPGAQHFGAMSGRIGALAVRKDGTILLGGAQGGIWKWSGDPANPAAGGSWTALTDNAVSLAMGALAVAPSNDNVVYAGTGEGHLSGDSYFGNGVLKSTDGGTTWNHISGDYFRGVAISRIVVHPTNANHLYAAVLRGRGGARRVTPAVHSRYGIWRSTDGGVSWTLLKEATEATGATDLEMDPQNPSILYASFWGDAMYKSTDGGATWTPIMNGILGTAAHHAANQTRFSIGLSHPAGQNAVLYAGFDWQDASGYHPSRVWKSTDEGASWTLLPAGAAPPDTDNVEDYCGGQCFYDNVIEAAPDNPNVVYAGGQFNYAVGSGGFFRSDDGGQTWIDLGFDQHPDFQAFAFDPNNSNKIVSGSDGGVWYSVNRGGRLGGGTDPLSAVNWVSLNGTMPNPASTAVSAASGLQIAQFTSIATVPTVPERFWGGTQDNGTMRKTTVTTGLTQRWFDIANGDGGQVLVDPTADPNENCEFHEFGATGPSCFVYGTYFGISPYRFSDGGAFFFNNHSITNGINLSDRSTFYIPMAMNKDNPNQLFLGTYRLYRTNNARTPAAGDVRWTAISPDLTAGCAGTAPNGARGCVLSAIGVGGGDAVYTGSEDGHVFFSPNAQTSAEPSWVRIDEQPRRDDDEGEDDEGDDDDDDWSWTRGRGLPDRPITQIAVDRSNYRIAYVAVAGFNPATPRNPGHLFKTTDAGKRWKDISGNLPDVPVNSVIPDPSYPNTLYVGTDVGAFVTYNGGRSYSKLGGGFPNVAVWQLDMNPSDVKRVLVAGTHGRGAFKLQDQSTPVPALVVSKIDAAVPVGPSSIINYTLTLKNIGNADATGVTITDPLPDHTRFVSADNGGKYSGGKVRWKNLTVPKASVAAPGVHPGVPGSIQVKFSVRIDSKLKRRVMRITNDGIVVASAQGPGATGSPFVTPIAPPFSVSLAPAAQTDGGKVGTNVDYKVTLTNVGFNADTYKLTDTGGTWDVSYLDATCTTPLAGDTTASVPSGASLDVCARVAVPAAAADASTSTATVTATSIGGAGVSASGTIKTIAVAVGTLLVDNDTDAPADSQPIYRDALNSASLPHQVWDLNLDDNLPLNYMKAFETVVWFTGNSWPQPLAPYEAKLISYLQSGGHLFMSGQDILDQSGGTTTFAHDYLHVDWDGSETQNDKNTDNVIGVAGTLTDGVGTVPLPGTFLGANFENRITPIAPAVTIFTDETAGPDNKRGLSVSTDGYKVVFLPFAFEAYGSAAQRTDLVNRVKAYFAAS
ncbi:MAG TPA: hypothetical protein VG144_05015 [Gaiellaceae bacterium]|nr:hypothetical protein [Gaiellaceae bacterium]